MNTLVVNLYGGPGTGKSTGAAYLFALCKMRDINAELVREYVKGWAWEQRKIGPLDQFYFFGKQLRAESALYGKVELIITDSSVQIGAYYAARYCSPRVSAAVRAAAQAARAEAEALGIQFFDVWLTRSKPYNAAGRYESEEQALAVDREQRPFVENLLSKQLRPYTTDYLELCHDIERLVGKVAG